MVYSYGNTLLLLTILKARGWWGHMFVASANPKASTKRPVISPSCDVHGGQYDAKYVTSK